MATCSVCAREVPVTDGVYGIHYNSGLLRCETSGQPVNAAAEPVRAVEAPTEATEPVPEPKSAKKAPPRKKSPPKS